MAVIHVSGFRKTYGSTVAVDDVSFDVNAGEILSRVLQRDPDWARLPANLPPSIPKLLRLCLQKDVRKRRQSAGDVRIDLEQALVGPAGATAAAIPVRGTRVAWVVQSIQYSGTGPTNPTALPAPSPFTTDLVDNAARLKLDVARVVHVHGGINPYSDVLKAAGR